MVTLSRLGCRKGRGSQPVRYFMATKEPLQLDLKTARIVKEVLDDAWYSLSPQQKAVMSKTALAERVLIAAKGERDRESLLATALKKMPPTTAQKSIGAG